MKRTVAFVLFATAILFAAVPFGGAGATFYNGTEGLIVAESWNAGGGHRVTVGWLPCGATWTFPDENGELVNTHDPNAHYYAKVKKGGAALFQTWAHDATDLNLSLTSNYGFGLTAEALAALDEVAAANPCAG